MRFLKQFILCAALMLALVPSPDRHVIAQEPTRAEPVIIERRETVTMPRQGLEGPSVGIMPELIVPAERPGLPGDTFIFLSSELSFDGKVVRGAPYSGQAVTETIQTLADGNRIVRKMTAAVYRDSEGRTRRDQSLNAIGPFAADGDPPQTILINDPVAGVNYVLDPRTRTARKMTSLISVERKIGEASAAPGGARTSLLPGGILNDRALKKVQPVYPAIARAAHAEGDVRVNVVVGEAGEVVSAVAAAGHPLLQTAAVDAARQWRFRPTIVAGSPVKVQGALTFHFLLEGGEEPAAEPASPTRTRIIAPQRQTESLGKRSFDGVEAEGTRTTVTIPAGQIGNELPISIVSERWYSPELQTVVMSRHNDPRLGETIYRLTDINRSEPARSLFEVPADYTVKESQTFLRGVRARRPETEQ